MCYKISLLNELIEKIVNKRTIDCYMRYVFAYKLSRHRGIPSALLWVLIVVIAYLNMGFLVAVIFDVVSKKEVQK